MRRRRGEGGQKRPVLHQTVVEGLPREDTASDRERLSLGRESRRGHPPSRWRPGVVVVTWSTGTQGSPVPVRRSKFPVSVVETLHLVERVLVVGPSVCVPGRARQTPVRTQGL